MTLLMKRISFFSLFLFNCGWVYSWQNPDWSAEAFIPLGETRENIYQLEEGEFQRARERGYKHALKWPVDVTGLLIPYQPLKFFLEEEKENPLRRFVERIAERKFGYQDMDGLYRWLGLGPFPEESERGIFRIPYPDGVKPNYRVGVSLLETPLGKGMTFSCATCHTGIFMGKTVMGLTNKRPRANEFFVTAKKYIPMIPAGFFQVATKATREEKKMFKRTQANLKFVGAKKPQVLGLDTSLAHVALSLVRRADDGLASKNPYWAWKPRRSKFEYFVADSKPMPWWNLKYKTRWLADGSTVSGNPILMNIFVNEIGRGIDLEELEQWMKDSEDKIKDLTVAVFSTKAPHWTDFFPVNSISLEAAQRGEKVFAKSCQKCHGAYQKAWSLPNAKDLSLRERLKTIRVEYHERTPVKNVGTDPNRWMAMKGYDKTLNKLRIVQWANTMTVAQKGYVPPPLEGIFLRYPYFHNNSIPNLCALMERPDRRPTRWVQGPSQGPQDYDQDCVGYPVGQKIPRRWWREREAIFDTTKPGLRNTGHGRVFWDARGNPKMSEAQKRDLREFLKTL